MTTAARRTARSRLARRSRGALAWFAATVLLGHAALVWHVDRVQPEFRDPEYGRKLTLLRQRLSAEPERPLVVILGSSRAELGVSPERMTIAPAAGEQPPIIMNMAVTGCGPVHELLILKRLLAQGIRPWIVLVEVHPLFLHKINPSWGEEIWKSPDRLEWADRGVLAAYHDQPSKITWEWLSSRTGLIHTLRYQVLNYYAPRWLPPDAMVGHTLWKYIDRSGWIKTPEAPLTRVDRRRRLDHARKEYADAFRNWRISQPPDRALREILELCRAQGMQSALFLMPEGDEFQSWYSPSMRDQTQAYLAGLQAEYGAPLIDATDWRSEEDFWDSHHLTVRAAERFSARFGREIESSVLRPRAWGASDTIATRPRRPGAVGEVRR